MDLDNLKKVWQETEVNTTIDDCKIQQMLNNKGKGALAQLARFEKLALWLLIVCVFCLPIFYKIHPLIFYMYGALLVVALGWQIYKIKFLNKIDFIEMGILDVSNGVNKYRKYIQYEIIIGVVYTIIFFAIFAFIKVHPDEYTTKSITLMLILFAVGVGISLTLVFVVYRYLYISNIRQLRKSIKEIEEFRKDNK